MKNNKSDEFVPLEMPDYIPSVVKRLFVRIKKEKNQVIALYGFSENMKWLFRLLKEENIDPILCDWRENFIRYDCGGKNLVSIESLKDDPKILVVICLEEIHELKSSIRFLIDKKINLMPVIYDRSLDHNPFEQEEPYKGIANRARARARSMISNDQLFDLIQFIRATSHIEGDVVEFGSLHGGSGAIIVEAVNYYKRKSVWLFDTFSGIPNSKYGLDHRWNGAFSDNSFQEVKNAFSDCDNVTVVKGNILETYSSIKNEISFGYLASDTLETGEFLLDFIWNKLNPGGIIVVCDYGSYPNCLPLTVMTDKFLEGKENEVFVYHPARVGIVIMKR